MAKKQPAAKRSKNSLCAVCKNNCKDMYPYGAQQVQPGCYFFRGKEGGGNA